MSKISFRESASNQYAAYEQIDSMMQIIRPAGWLWLLACLFFCLGLLAWAVTGKMVTRVAGQGIVVHKDGLITYVLAPESGRMTQIKVSPGQRIAKDEVMAEIAQPVLERELTALQKELSALKSQYAMKSAAADKASLEEHILDTQERLEEAVSRHRMASQVVAGFDGIVGSWLLHQGALVERYQPLVQVETGGEDLQALVFFPSGSGKEIQPGQMVEVSPRSINVDETGFLWGKVTSISTLPLSQVGMKGLVADEALVQDWSAKLHAPLAARIDFLRDPNSADGLKWSSERGQGVQLTTGTLLDASVRVREELPIALFAPAYKKMLRGR